MATSERNTRFSIRVPYLGQDVDEALPRVFESLGASPLGRAVPRVTDAAVGRSALTSAYPGQVGVGEQDAVWEQADVPNVADGAHTLHQEVVEKLMHK